MAEALRMRGELVEAQTLAERALAIQEEVWGPRQLRLRIVLITLAWTTAGRADPAGVRGYAAKLIELLDADASKFAMRTDGWAQAAGALGLAGLDDEAVAHGQRAVQIAEENHLAGDYRLGIAHLYLCQPLVRLRRYREAAKQCEEALPPLASSFGADSHPVAQAIEWRARALVGLGRTREAVPLFEQSLAILAKAYAETGQAASVSFALARALERQDPVRARTLAIRARDELVTVKVPAFREELAEMDAWLQARSGN
jgi:tetratricopeptide (TPR) repeat protein